MGIEIERKFLIDIDKITNLGMGTSIKQGYISNEINPTVRLRTRETKGYITVKGENTDISRPEFEYEIPIKDALEMMSLFCKTTLSKTRYEVLVGSHIWEIDIFHGDNDGLIIAELELKTDDEDFVMPDWVINEVSDETMYYNSNLIKKPFCSW